MPARANIVVNDGQATPVAHTFNPAENGDNDLFEDKSGGIPIGFPTIVTRFQRPAPGAAASVSNRVYRIKTTVSWPTLESTSASTGTGIPPAPTVAYVNRCVMEWIHPERSTLANRKDARAIVYNLLANTDYKKVVEELDPYY